MHVLLHEPLVHLPETSISLVTPVFAANLVPRLPALFPCLPVELPHPAGHERDHLQRALISRRTGVAPKHLALGVAEGSLDYVSPHPSVGSDGYLAVLGL